LNSIQDDLEISDEEDSDEEEEQQVRVLQAEDDKEALDNFEQEKDEQFTKDFDKKNKGKFDVLRGWGDWAGEGVNEEKLAKKQDLMEKKKRERSDKLKKDRSDSKLKGVKIEAQERDKKFARKYQV